MTSNSPTNGKNSLTFESIVCSQLELKRHAASFTNRRNTMCRRLSYIPSSSPPSSTTTTTTGTAISISPLNARASTSSTLADLSIHFLKTKDSTNDRKRSRAASFNSTTGNTLRQSVAERQSVGSILYWDPSRNPSTTRHESQVSKWSIDFHKDTPHYGSLRSRLVEEYTDCESLLEFAKKTVLVLIQTKVATVFLGLLLILPITMMSIGVSHLSDCPKQTHLPIYLFVAGIVWTTKLLQNIWHKYRLQQKASNDEEPPSERNDGHAFIDGLMTSFLIIWFFLGHYWLSTLDYPLQFEQPLENPDVWCDKSVVLCTFASIFITYFILITFIIIVVCLVCCTRYTIIKRASSSQI
ncbi:unnamed protein product [Adineta steineri]|uniref:Uncharacterized protein n=1 Tax=Adineta steineri TaxID=433720 RepID=A0A818ZSF0_9BILA|nr:unnamed protein product [Adineta steineri]CAF3769092.1 unnamed protein product [Adineta steineri]